MDAPHGATMGRRRAGVLFDEDFDIPAAPDPEVIAPGSAPRGLTDADVAAARADAWAEGHGAGRAAAEAAAAQALAGAAAAMANEMTGLREELRASSEMAADALARLLLDTLATLFPTLCARHGAAEVRAVVRTLLPGLALEPDIVVRVHPDTAPALAAEVARAMPDEAGRVRVIPDPAMGPADVRLRWQGGTATRDGAALWEEVAAALAPAGLLSARTRERAHVE